MPPLHLTHPTMKFIDYAKQSGPGWLQAAVTLGGGSLIGALYLGVIGGYNFMWLQPLAMACGVIMLAAISHVTLSTGDRPFRTVQNTVSPTLAWAWLIATIIADTVFCAAQFALGRGAIEQNLGGGSIPPFVITGGFFVISMALIWMSTGGTKSAKNIENILKALVAIVVIAFMGVVVKLALAGAISWGKIFAGLVPDISALFKPTASFRDAIAATGDNATFWTEYVKSSQRDVIITAFGTAVGINMTFLLPYTLLKRKWGKAQRQLSRFDLAFGLFVPFILATSFLVIASASQFHAQTSDVILADGTIAADAQNSYAKILTAKLGDSIAEDATPADVIAIANETLTTADRELAAMLVKRDAGALAKSLEPFLGKAAQPIFGIGVLAMAFSTMLVHMMMNGYAVSEAFDRVENRKVFIIGASMPAIAGFFSPILWSGDSKAALAVPASVIATCLLPIAYLTFLLLMNSRKALGDEIPKHRLLVNAAMIFATAMATLGSVWVLLNKGAWGQLGLALLAILAIVGITGYIRRSRAI